MIHSKKLSKKQANSPLLRRSVQAKHAFSPFELLNPFQSKGSEDVAERVLREAKFSCNINDVVAIMEEAQRCDSDAQSNQKAMTESHAIVSGLLRDLQALNEASVAAGAGSIMLVDVAIPQDVSPIIEGMLAKTSRDGVKRKPIILTPHEELAPAAPESQTCKAEGSGMEIILQAFNWESHKGDYYSMICKEAKWYADLGFTYAWLPPPTASVSPEGYMPTDYFNLNSAYGDEGGLRNAVSALKEHGVRVAGDCVLNHRCALKQDRHGVWNQFGGRLNWDATAICSDDNNFGGQGNHSTGDMFHAAPNIDHTQPFVRDGITEWLQWLRTDVGIDGYRLDFARGFGGEFIAEYASRTIPHFVVGEYWDCMSYDSHGVALYNQDGHRQQIINWINKAEGRATAFDVTTKGIMHEVLNRGQYNRLRDGSGKPPGVLGWWPSRATTFLENHDTGSTQGHWRFPHHGLEQGYCYILTHPGTPTIFYDHLHDPSIQKAISVLISIRRANGIHVRSTVNILKADRLVYAAMVDERLVMKIGPDHYHPGDAWRQVAMGNCWCVWER